VLRSTIEAGSGTTAVDAIADRPVHVQTYQYSYGILRLAAVSHYAAV
jgi:hypothetical protein